MGRSDESKEMNRMRQLRTSTGMNRREFCECFEIPYRTVTDWELGNRHAPDYVLRLMEYYIRMEGLVRPKDESAAVPETDLTKAASDAAEIETDRGEAASDAAETETDRGEAASDAAEFETDRGEAASGLEAPESDRMKMMTDACR